MPIPQPAEAIHTSDPETPTLRQLAERAQQSGPASGTTVSLGSDLGPAEQLRSQAPVPVPEAPSLDPAAKRLAMLGDMRATEAEIARLENGGALPPGLADRGLDPDEYVERLRNNARVMDWNLQSVRNHQFSGTGYDEPGDLDGYLRELYQRPGTPVSYDDLTEDERFNAIRNNGPDYKNLRTDEQARMYGKAYGGPIGAMFVQGGAATMNVALEGGGGGTAVRAAGAAGVSRLAARLGRWNTTATDPTPLPAGTLYDRTFRPVDSPNYSVVYEAQLTRGAQFPGRSDKVHFQEANRQLHGAMESDPQFAAALEAQYPGLTAGVQPGVLGRYPRRPPIGGDDGLTWNHDVAREGVMQLVPTPQHTAPGPVQQTLHPDQQGGMQTWGGGR